MTLTRRMFLGAAGAVTTLTLWPWQGQARTAGDTRRWSCFCAEDWMDCIR